MAKEIAKVHVNDVFLTKSKITKTPKPKSKHKNPCQSRESIPRRLSPQSESLPLSHRVNLRLTALNLPRQIKKVKFAL